MISVHSSFLWIYVYTSRLCPKWQLEVSQNLLSREKLKTKPIPLTEMFILQKQSDLSYTGSHIKRYMIKTCYCNIFSNGEPIKFKSYKAVVIVYTNLLKKFEKDNFCLSCAIKQTSFDRVALNMWASVLRRGCSPNCRFSELPLQMLRVWSQNLTRARVLPAEHGP